MSDVTYKDASDATQRIDTFTRTENGQTVNMQAVVVVDRLGVPLSDAPAHIFDTTTDPLYIYECWAVAGTASSAAAWRCARTTIATGHTQWVDGGNYTQVADNRAGLTYV